jgi:hypothetical protein
MRPVRENPRSVATVRFEEGAQALAPRLPQSSQVRRMLVIIVKGMDPPKPEVVM